MYAPVPEETVCRVTFVASFSTVIWAFGTADPDGSKTVPVIPAAPICAFKTVGDRTARNRSDAHAHPKTTNATSVDARWVFISMSPSTLGRHTTSRSQVCRH